MRLPGITLTAALNQWHISFQGKLANESVSISSCQEAPCKLRKKSDVIVSVRFTPENDIAKFLTHVHIKLLGIPFPFIGVDGVSACGKVFESDGKTKASCPLKKGKEYMYQNSFKVLEIYPTIERRIEHHTTKLDSNMKDVQEKLLNGTQGFLRGRREDPK
ncbi:Niemann-Pick type C-2b [Rhodnius prolixus]|uniref:Niemann-Pick type C-2b n=1 Tax=Rhodnius prolixus TaxID=13249 RepID=UPI003D18794C